MSFKKKNPGFCGCSDPAKQIPADMQVEGSEWEGKCTCCEKNPVGFLAQVSKGRSKTLTVEARPGTTLCNIIQVARPLTPRKCY